MKDIKELQDYIEKTGDSQFGMLVDIVKKYGNDIPGIIKTIKDKHVENDEKEKAEIIFQLFIDAKEWSMTLFILLMILSLKIN